MAGCSGTSGTASEADADYSPEASVPESSRPDSTADVGSSDAHSSADGTSAEAGTHEAGADSGGSADAHVPDGSSPHDAASDGIAVDGATDGHASDDGSSDARASDVTSDVMSSDSAMDAAGPDTSAPADAAADASSPLVLPACLGMAAPITLSGTSAYTSVEVGLDFAADAGLSPPMPFLIDFGSTYSDIDLSAFSPAPAAHSCDPTKLGQISTFADAEFFGPWSPAYFDTADFSSIKGTVRQAGLLATDFFSLYPFTIDYQGLRILEGSTTAFCADADLKAAGFAPMATTGFYSSDLNSLNSLSTVDSSVDASAGTVPNVPTVTLRLAGVDGLAQLDTGFEDSVVHHSVNVNQAFYKAIQSHDAGALKRDSSLDLTLTTCIAGTSELVKAYHLTTGNSMDFIADGGGVARSVSDVVVFVKNTPAAAQVCGGIGTWTVPAAQVATSFYAEAGAIVFDPLSERVWIPQ
jgi:hypothetical protein